ncbi:MAG: peptide-N-glycosidase F-related protein [Bacteroidales bacterium]|nr:peptide-N-glycosidase F-related protein [Bacteroidales bacterium]
MKRFLLVFLALLIFQLSDAQPDTLVIQTFSWDDPSPEGWSAPYRGTFDFPDDDRTWEKILMVRKLKCDSATRGDQYPCGEWDYHTHTMVYLPDGDTLEGFELGSFITPYGKRLKMGGEAGWTWVYDVTDYAPLLKGKVDLKSGNNQELLDMKFMFIEGTPPRDVISVQNLWPQGLYKYAHLADDSLLTAREILLDPQAEGYMLRARISGHGHNGPRNCCEWDSKTHTYYIGDWDHFRWNVWTDCGFNAIYPQGGTWPFDRAGWCPGTRVDEHDFELTPFVHPGDTITIDYGIEMYKDNGEKDGEFRMSHQLFTYGPPNFNVDACIEDILAPSDKDVYSRINPICSNPIIVIRNLGKVPLKTAVIKYGLKGGPEARYTWAGHLEFLEKEQVVLPAPDWQNFEGKLAFEVKLLDPNGETDERPQNNSMRSVVVAPEVLPDEFILYIEPNDLDRDRDNSYFLTDECGSVAYAREDFTSDTLFMDKVSLEPGCYEFRLTDKVEDGMNRHWWYYYENPEMMGKNGRIEIHDMNGNVIRKFPYDFGQEILYRFVVK